MMCNGNSGCIHERKGSHSNFKTFTSGFIDRRDVRQTLVQHPYRLIQPGNEVSVDGKPRRILDDDGNLTCCAREDEQCFDHLRFRLFSCDDLE